MTNQITLPRDAEGREIPLDTTVLYSLSGKEHEVDTFTYSPSEGIWRVALVKEFVQLYTCDLHLAPVVVLCADGKPVNIRDTVYCDDSPEPLTVRSFTVSECGPVDVRSADGAFYTVSAGRLTHERPDSWEKLLEDLDNAAEKASSSIYIAPCCAWFSGGDRRCGDCPADESPGVSCNVQLINDISARIRKLRGEE